MRPRRRLWFATWLVILTFSCAGAQPSPSLAHRPALEPEIRAALDQPCPHSKTLLAAAVRAKRPESVRALFDLGASPNARAERGWTPLHVAALWNTPDIAEWLLDAGADVNARDEHSLTPLHHAARAGHTALAALLLKRGADVNAQTT
ncbi:MAG: ankyrin repeat domain-containing protein, partial [Verrucomicrobiae bacterium]|nr:ankyrin repeat domain-containing protein [Verrucomicrobiae bacterium]